MTQEDTKIFQFLFFSNSPIVLLWHTVIYCVILAVTYMYVRRTKCSYSSSSSAIPGPKLPFSSIIGFGAALPSRSTRMKLSLPVNAFFLQLFGGIAVLFPEEKMVAGRIGLQQCVILKKAESVEEFLCSNVLTTKPFREILLPFFGNGLFLSSGAKWKSRKKLLTPWFHYGMLKECVPVFDKEAKVLVEILSRKQHEPWIDVVHPLTLCTMGILCKTLVGINVEAQKESGCNFVSTLGRVTQTMIQRVVNPLYHLEMLFAVSALGRQFRKDITYLREYAQQSIKYRKEERKLRKQGETEDKPTKSDLMDFMIDVEEKHSDITLEDVRDELMSFILAGVDATSSGLSWSLYLIGLHPEIQSKIHEELDGIFGDDGDREITVEDLKQMDYLDCVLKESRRVYPTSAFNARYTLEDCTISDFKIKKGNAVIIDTYDLHRDPDVFPNPEVFDPERFRPENCVGRSSFAYVPFSGGVRSCMGKSFTEMEAKTVVANVLHKFSLKSLEPRDKIHTSFGIVLRPHRPLKVKFIPRNFVLVMKGSEGMH